MLHIKACQVHCTADIAVWRCKQKLRIAFNNFLITSAALSPRKPHSTGSTHKLTVTLLSLLSSNAQERKYFWKPYKPCHVGWYSLDSPQGVLSYEYPCARVSLVFQFFLHYFELAKCATSSIRVNPFERSSSKKELTLIYPFFGVFLTFHSGYGDDTMTDIL